MRTLTAFKKPTMNISTPMNLPDIPVNSLPITEYESHCRHCFDVIGAAADYFVESTRTEELANRIYLQKTALDKRNSEMENRAKAQLEAYIKQLQINLDSWKKQLSVNVEKITMENELRLKQTIDKHHKNTCYSTLIMNEVNHYLNIIHEADKLITELDKAGDFSDLEHYKNLQALSAEEYQYIDKCIMKLLKG